MTVFLCFRSRRQAKMLEERTRAMECEAALREGAANDSQTDQTDNLKAERPETDSPLANPIWWKISWDFYTWAFSSQRCLLIKMNPMKHHIL